MATWIAVLLSLSLLLVAYQAFFLPILHSLLRNAVLNQQARIIGLLQEGAISTKEPSIKTLLESVEGTLRGVSEVNVGTLVLAKRLVSLQEEKRITRKLKKIDSHSVKDVPDIHQRLVLLFALAFCLNSLVALPIVLLYVLFKTLFSRRQDTNKNWPSVHSIPAPAERTIKPLRIRYSV